MDSFKCAEAVFLAAALCLAGCEKAAEAPAGVPLAEVPATLDASFQEASAETKALASSVNASMQKNDVGGAFFELQALSSREDLTPGQRKALGEVKAAVGKELNAAAERGDPRAIEALNIHRSRK